MATKKKTPVAPKVIETKILTVTVRVYDDEMRDINISNKNLHDYEILGLVAMVKMATMGNIKMTNSK